ncbi:uncharacterized protein LOC111892890 isoform X7 [Lactuca sativa]|uniref:uncharacterized protein LOC111892890 isoform X7 n=1 Tax=Lactuca sativa TaxID=4236 RepID=UPI000CD86670|nr:uncharacterized protein LOC111892890 isoform X7 [Lactuca sativa]
MAAPFFSTPFQPFVYQTRIEGYIEKQSQDDAVTPFQILGGEVQIVQIMLKPEDKVSAKPGCMCYMSGSIQMENVYAPENEAGMWQWVFGKNATKTIFVNSGSTDGFVAMAAPSLGRILPVSQSVNIDLARFGGEILCQPDAFLCSIGDVKVSSNTFDQRGPNRNVVERLLRQKVSGQGLAFMVGGGSVVQKNLEVGEILSVDICSIIALSTTVDVQIKYNGGESEYGDSNDERTRNCVYPEGVASPNMRLRDNPKLLMQILVFSFLAYLVLGSFLLYTDF